MRTVYTVVHRMCRFNPSKYSQMYSGFQRQRMPQCPTLHPAACASQSTIFNISVNASVMRLKIIILHIVHTQKEVGGQRRRDAQRVIAPLLPAACIAGERSR